MVTHTRRLLAGLLILGAGLAATPVHAAPLPGFNPFTPPVYPSPGGPTLTITPNPYVTILNGSGFVPGNGVNIYVYTTSYQLMESFPLSATVPSYMTLCTPTACRTVAGGTFTLDFGTAVCVPTVNVIAFDVRDSKWSNWVQAPDACY